MCHTATRAAKTHWRCGLSRPDGSPPCTQCEPRGACAPSTPRLRLPTSFASAHRRAARFVPARDRYRGALHPPCLRRRPRPRAATRPRTLFPAASCPDRRKPAQARGPDRRTTRVTRLPTARRAASSKGS
jgi:hypothetical protein